MVGYSKFTWTNMISEGLSAFFSHFFSFVALAALVMSPYLIYLLYVISQLSADNLDKIDLLLTRLRYAGILNKIILTPIATAGVTYGIFQHLKGGRASLGQCLQMGLNRFLPLIGASILVGVIVILGCIALLIPGLILFCMYSLVAPVIVVEHHGISDAMARSKELTDGYKRSIFSAVIGLAFLYGIFQAIVRAVVLGANPRYRAEIPAFLSRAKPYLLVNAMVQVGWVALSASLIVVIYHGIRCRKEKIDIHKMISVFD